VVLREKGQPERADAIRLICGLSEADYDKHILFRTFQGSVNIGPRSIQSAAAMLRFVYSAPGAIGYVAADQVDATVKTLRIDGALPGDAISAPADQPRRRRFPMIGQPRRRSAAAYVMFALLAAATLTVVALGWVVARDFRQSAEAANQLYVRFGAGLDLIDDMLFETEEVRRILLYALHTLDANRQLEYVDQSRAAEARVRTAAREPVAAALHGAHPRGARIGGGRMGRVSPRS